MTSPLPRTNPQHGGIEAIEFHSRQPAIPRFEDGEGWQDFIGLLAAGSPNCLEKRPTLGDTGVRTD